MPLREPGDTTSVTARKSRPLAGRTIVITRAQHQAGEFSHQLARLGARVIEFPTIEIVPPESWNPVDEAIADLRTYDWIVFTSANGANHFVQRLCERKGGVDDLRHLRICAIGPRTAEQIESENLDVHLIPREYRAEAIVDSLAKEGLKDRRILLARAKKAREVLPQALRKQGAHVDVVAVYQTVQPRGEVSEFLRLVKERRIDAIAFTSSSTVFNFMEMFAAYRNELLNGLHHVAIAVIGPITRGRAIELGLHVDISPAEYTVPALAAAIGNHFAARSG